MNHIKQHYEETLHTYAMDASSRQRVWDFAGDGFVHRLILNSDEEENGVNSNRGRSSSSGGNRIIGEVSETRRRGSQDTLRTKVVEVVDPRILSGEIGPF